MTAVKKGHLAQAQEWCKHLRPKLKRYYWKRERRAGISDAAVQVTETPAQSDLYTAIRRRFEPLGGVDLPEIKREPIRPVDLE
jgi:hypothetical protein